jgi:flagellar biosynthesis protein FliQ
MRPVFRALVVSSLVVGLCVALVQEIALAIRERFR